MALDVFSLISQISLYQIHFCKIMFLKINIILCLLPNILLLNLIELYNYDYQILDSFGISEFAQCSNLDCMA